MTPEAKNRIKQYSDEIIEEMKERDPSRPSEFWDEYQRFTLDLASECRDEGEFRERWERLGLYAGVVGARLKPGQTVEVLSDEDWAEIYNQVAAIPPTSDQRQ
jgi:hypothetical protein